MNSVLKTRLSVGAGRVTRRGVGARSRRGFSLLEITLVLAIIGVLMAVAAVNVIGGAERAKIRATKASMETVVTQLKTYHLENNKYPESLLLLVTSKPAYLEKLPKDGWDRDFYYRVPGRNNRPYDLISFGQDGEGNTEDDIDYWVTSGQQTVPGN